MADFVIVDDSQMARNMLRNILEEAGHTVVAEGSNGLEGFDLYVEYKPDCLTLDITMPLVSGVACLKKIMQHYPDAVVAVVTTVGKNTMIEEVKEIGAKAVMVKPYEKEDALRVLALLGL